VKILLWMIALIAAATVLTLAASHNQGAVVIFLPPHRVDLSFNFFLLLALLLFLLLYVIARLVHRAIHLPNEVRVMREEKKRQKGRRLLDEALHAFFSGRFATTEKLAREATTLGESPVAGRLLGAFAAHKVRDAHHCQEHLTQAEDLAKDKTAIWVTRAELGLADHDAQSALADLARLKTTNTHILTLKLKAARQSGDWAGALTALNQLEKRGRLEPVLAEQLRFSFYRELFLRRTGDPAAVLDLWRGLPGAERYHPKVVHFAARALMESDDPASGANIIAEGLDKEWDDDLARLFGQMPGPQPLKQIERAEAWLKDHPRDANLLCALGALCARCDLWGKAQSYLEASLSIADNPETHVALGRLLERSGAVERACEHYRQALAEQFSP
jgi:HemY protein